MTSHLSPNMTRAGFRQVFRQFLAASMCAVTGSSFHIGTSSGHLQQRRRIRSSWQGGIYLLRPRCAAPEQPRGEGRAVRLDDGLVHGEAAAAPEHEAEEPRDGEVGAEQRHRGAPHQEREELRSTVWWCRYNSFSVNPPQISSLIFWRPQCRTRCCRWGRGWGRGGRCSWWRGWRTSRPRPSPRWGQWGRPSPGTPE